MNKVSAALVAVYASIAFLGVAFFVLAYIYFFHATLHEEDVALSWEEDAVREVEEDVEEIEEDVDAQEDERFEEYDFSFLDTGYVFAQEVERDGVRIRHFVPPGQSAQQWDSRVTITRDLSRRNASREDLDEIMEGIIGSMSEDGWEVVSVYDHSHGGVTYTILIMALYDDERRSAQVDLKKLFIHEEGAVMGNSYQMHVQGESGRETGLVIRDELSRIFSPFIVMTFPPL